MRMKPLVLWSAAAVLAVGASSAAVSAATSGTGHDVLSPADVSRALAASDAPVVTTSPAPTASAPVAAGQPTATGQPLDTPGGMIVVTCGEAGPVLLRWVPKSGYRVGHIFDAGGGQAGIVFEAAGDHDVTVVVACATDKATVKYSIGSDDHGGKGGGAH